MDSRSGKKIRLGRLLDPKSGHGIVVAASHGVQSGPPEQMHSPEQIEALFGKLGSADGIMVAPGLLALVENHYVGPNAPALVVHTDWKNSTRAVYPAGVEGRGEGVVAALTTVEDALAAGAAGIMTYLHVGQDDTALEREEVERNARLARECDRLGVVCIIEPRSARERADGADARSSRVASFYCRMAAEIGADIVKCIWPGSPEAFAEVTGSCPAPVLLAGGPGGADEAATVRLAAAATGAGARGVMFGRRITSALAPENVLARLRAVVHHRLSAEQALALDQ